MTQLLGLVVSALLTIILIMSIYVFVIRQQRRGAAPSGKFATLLEAYYEGFMNLLDSLSGGNNKWAYPYFFTLFHFILINCLVPWIGFESAATSIMFTFPLALVTFIMIYVIGIGTMGFINFCRHKYANPMELVLQFAPLISMSVRLFAATLAGAIIGNVPWIIVQGIVGPVYDGASISMMMPVYQILVMWVWKVADTMLSLIQSFVFMTLTVIFWSMDTGSSWSKKSRIADRDAQIQKEVIAMFDESTKVVAIVNPRLKDMQEDTRRGQSYEN